MTKPNLKNSDRISNLETDAASTTRALAHAYDEIEQEASRIEALAEGVNSVAKVVDSQNDQTTLNVVELKKKISLLTKRVLGLEQHSSTMGTTGNVDPRVNGLKVIALDLDARLKNLELTAYIAPRKPEGGITLQLTKEEAEVMLSLTRAVHGNPAGTARGVTDEIMARLRRAGVDILFPSLFPRGVEAKGNVV